MASKATGEVSGKQRRQEKCDFDFNTCTILYGSSFLVIYAAEAGQGYKTLRMPQAFLPRIGLSLRVII